MRRKYSVGWFSSYDRGLNVLMDIWPEVLKEVPKATLDVAYGWNTFDKFHSKNPERMKFKWMLIRKFNEFGVKEHGRLSHVDLAKLMKNTQVLAYPTSFPEIDCITVKKAQASGMNVVTSGYAALQESILKDEEEIENIHDKPEKLKEFTERLTQALKEPLSEKERKKTAKKVLEKYDWARIAKQWDEALQ